MNYISISPGFVSKIINFFDETLENVKQHENMRLSILNFLEIKKKLVSALPS